MSATYKIVRFHFDGDNQTIAWGQSLEQAQAHCERDDTSGSGWFDGYVQETEDDDDEDDDNSYECDTCGRIGTVDDGISGDGGECPDEDCGGTVHVVLR